MHFDLETALADLPLVAILRGVKPEEVVAVAEVVNFISLEVSVRPVERVAC